MKRQTTERRYGDKIEQHIARKIARTASRVAMGEKTYIDIDFTDAQEDLYAWASAYIDWHNHELTPEFMAKHCGEPPSRIAMTPFWSRVQHTWREIRQMVDRYRKECYRACVKRDSARERRRRKAQEAA